MKNLSIYVLVILFFSACSFNSKCLDKESFIEGYEKFSVDVEKHYKNLSGEDWIDIDNEFKEYVDVCYIKFKEEMSTKERITFFKHTFSYSAYRGHNSKSYDLDIDLDLGQELEEMTTQGRKELEEYIRQEVKPELNQAIDDIIHEVEDIGDKLKEFLNNI